MLECYAKVIRPSMFTYGSGRLKYFSKNRHYRVSLLGNNVLAYV